MPCPRPFRFAPCRSVTLPRAAAAVVPCATPSILIPPSTLSPRDTTPSTITLFRPFAPDIANQLAHPSAPRCVRPSVLAARRGLVPSHRPLLKLRLRLRLQLQLRRRLLARSCVPRCLRLFAPHKENTSLGGQITISRAHCGTRACRVPAKPTEPRAPFPASLRRRASCYLTRQPID